MSRLQSNCLIAAVTVAIMAGYLLHLNIGCLNQEKKEAAPGEAPCSQSYEAPDTIEDLSKIPQDIRRFAAMIKETMGTDEQAQVMQQFHERYFAPWTTPEPLFNVSTVTEQVKMFAERTWYGENRQIVEPERMQGLLALADLDRLPSMNQLGIVIKPTFIRILPTIRPFYETPDDFPFDQLQFSEIKPNEPIRILHATKDGAWLYIETSYANGWIEPDAVRVTDESLQKRMIKAPRVVIVRDFAIMQTERGDVLPQPKIGTLYPLVQEEPDHWLVNVAVAGSDRDAALATARIAKNNASRHPLSFSPEALTLIGNELLKTPYGWGELYRNRDCSATTRDFFLAFGIWLPRNSLKQITSGPLVSLANLSSIDKEKLIREQGIPFRTLLHQKGHIMLYIGLDGEKPIVLHTAWAFRYKRMNCPENKLVIGRTVLSTLEIGKELPLSKGTILDRLDRMLLLPVMPGERIEKDQTSHEEKKLILPPL
ncbi:NlpC/P60 family N-terminal domain-containing protein [uncultured Desulfobulbus sp.]|uniref:NlpC/P60 family N-terminal domain-containing protein n=1 Tax=uncultured Desulfobulbus sp. TaxID=239745 RepID=UPI0029C96DEB|nr:NlpC/P60 family N-terminal domain-containing protein [uncultured Desulfobulbus sp.]